MEGEGGQPEAGYTFHWDTASAVCSISDKTDIVHRIGRDGLWQQFGTTCTLIKAPQWLHGPCSVPLWIDRVEKSHL